MPTPKEIASTTLRDRPSSSGYPATAVTVKTPSAMTFGGSWGEQECREVRREVCREIREERLEQHLEDLFQ